MNILITGSNGQLGSELKILSIYYKKFTFFFKDLNELDICNKKQLNFFIEENKINIVINCAAYTDVDKAEHDSITAKNVNTKGVLNLVKALEKVDGKLIHISTDYVFKGNNFIPYRESDEVSPIGIYGKTKRGGELAVIKSYIDAIVIRTSWLYSAHGNNFVKTILNLGNERDEIGVIFDQIGSPTNASDLAKACLDILLFKYKNKISSKGKLYHFANNGVASWYDFSKAILAIGKINCNVIPIETKDYPKTAKRPHFSVLNSSKIKNDFKIEIPYWRDSLERCIYRIKTTKN